MATDIKAVVFDFGNVIINIDLEKTFQAFSDLTFKSVERIRSLFAESDIFRKYETGFYSDDEFRDVVRQTLSYPLNDQEIDEAWNALLLDVPPERLAYLENLRFRYPVYLLSNTNAIHIEKCQQYFRNRYRIPDFRKLFTQAFFSYEMGLWKPDYKIYQKVLEETGYPPSEVLFLDDNADNIEAAKDMGIQTIKINPPESFVDILEKIL